MAIKAPNVNGVTFSTIIESVSAPFIDNIKSSVFFEQQFNVDDYSKAIKYMKQRDIF